MAYTIPSDAHASGDSGHTTDHNNLADVVALVTRATAQQVNLGSAADPAGNAGNVTLIQSYISAGKSAAPNLGMQLRTGGGNITTANIASAISAGYTGMFLDPGYVWNMGGVVFDAKQNFVIESRMSGSIGWTGNIAYNTGGYIDTGSGTDGIQIFATTPAGATATQGIIFRNCVIKGTNTRAVVHFGGGNRRCGLVDCLVYNANSSAGAYAVVNGSALSDNNSEHNIFRFTGGGGLAGAYAALGIGVADQTQRANDTWYYDMPTAGGTYSIRKDNGGGHTFIGWYDRSSPTTATVYNHGGGRLHFVGGEHQNGSGVSILSDAAACRTLIEGATITATTNATTIQVSAGLVAFRGYTNFNSSNTIAISGTGVVDLADTSIDASNASISGTAGKLVRSTTYTGVGAAPVVTGWSGTTQSV